MDQTANTPAQPVQRYVLIDLLRFMICLGIVIWHYQHFSFLGRSLPGFDVRQQPFYDWFRLFYENGHQFRVQLFWSISGFVLFLAYGRAIAGRSIGWRKFFLDRFARLYPLYLLSFGLVVVLQALYLRRNGDYFVYVNNDVLHAALTLVMASNWWPGTGLSFNGPVWSLSVLVPLYVVFFASVWRWGLSIRVSLAMTVVSSALYTVLPGASVVECAAHFHAGAIGAIVFMRYGSGRYGPALRRLAGVALIGLCVVTWGWGRVVIEPHMHEVLLVAVPILCFASASVRGIPVAMGRLCQRLGALSYGVYLLHFPLQLTLVLAAQWVGSPLPVLSPWLFLVYLGATVLLAQAGFVLCERPARAALLRRFDVTTGAGVSPMGPVDNQGSHRV